MNRVLREVNSLSRVSHQYIVRYYSCWLEEVGPPETQGLADDMTASTTTSSHVSSEEDIFAVNFDDLSVSRRDQSRSASFPRIRFTDGSDSDDSEDGSDEDSGDSDDSESTIPDPSASDHRRGKPLSKAISVPSKPSGSYTGTTTDDGLVQRILYIQMEFVEKVSSQCVPASHSANASRGYHCGSFGRIFVETSGADPAGIGPYVIAWHRTSR